MPRLEYKIIMCIAAECTWQQIYRPDKSDEKTTNIRFTVSFDRYLWIFQYLPLARGYRPSWDECNVYRTHAHTHTHTVHTIYVHNRNIITIERLKWRRQWRRTADEMAHCRDRLDKWRAEKWLNRITRFSLEYNNNLSLPCTRRRYRPITIYTHK